MKRKFESKTIVLKKVITEDDLCALVEEKKADSFRSMLRKPKRRDVRIESSTLNYECITSISGGYEADYFRKASHTISVDKNVDEVVFGGGVFPIRTRSAFRKRISGKLGKNKVDLPVEEHVHVEDEGKFYFDTGGKEIKLTFRVNSKTVEHYPHRVLDGHDSAIIESTLSEDDLISELTLRLRPGLGDEIRDLSEETIVREIDRIYVPVYEAVLFGPKGRTATIRVDAVRGKIL